MPPISHGSSLLEIPRRWRRGFGSGPGERMLRSPTRDEPLRTLPSAMAPPPAPLHLHVAGVSDPGRFRSDNQDAIGWIDLTPPEATEEAHLVLLADGAGGHAGGAAASRRAVAWLLTEARRATPADGAALVAMVREAHRQVVALAREMGAAGNMGTTVVACLIRGHEALVAHVGDSRLYRIHHEVCGQVTHDHSFVWELLRRGAIAQEEILRHPQRGVITRCLGFGPEAEPELAPPILLEAGDRLILCCDGLIEVVSDADIGAIARDADPEGAAAALVKLANERGTRDNVSVVVVAAETTEAGRPTPPASPPHPGDDPEATNLVLGP